MKGILDSSVVLRFLLNRDESLREAQTLSWVGASDLLFVECHRVLERARLQGELDGNQYAEALDWLRTFFDGINFLGIDGAVVRKAARSYPIPLKTLDAIHLATLEIIADDDDPRDWCMVSTDATLARAARLLGFEVLPS